eukprot:CAMPEP_0197855078 /NCGR_PEP_ID=MMETSP1438-20131217/25922_1 /TAXON_ID=1461541 /ORGANISM="Pterosperma sp., Strain CCMP1384" /LENGTH=55 /DNA_ID=CAMNT_0043470055 /DNA_START=575 /DNA_END=742 /DNA_ORIENTATION=+
MRVISAGVEHAAHDAVLAVHTLGTSDILSLGTSDTQPGHVRHTQPSHVEGKAANV